MRKSIFYKIFAGNVLAMVVFVALLVFFSFGTIRDFYIDALSENLQVLAASLENEVTEYFVTGNIDQLNDHINFKTRSLDLRVTVVDSTGKVLADSDESPLVMENHSNRPEIQAALQNGSGSSTRFSETVQKQMYYFAKALEVNSRRVGAIRVSLYAEDFTTLLGDFRRNLLKIIGIVFVVVLLGSFFFSKSLTNSIRQLAEAFKKVAKGDFKTNIILKKEDELKDLADSFNSMTNDINNLFEEVSKKKEDLNTILTSMQEGLLLINKEGKIQLYNKSFSETFKNGKIDDKFYWEIFNVPELSSLIKSVEKEKKSLTEEIEFGDKTFLCSVSFLPLKSEIIIVFSDVTDIRQFYQIKKDFVANVSHELRTPLTAIKGYAETMLDELSGETRNYAEVINRHTGRLINLVQDILVLSTLESRGSELELTNLNCTELHENLKKIFNDRLAEKKLDFTFNAPSDLPKIEVDAFRIEQLLINLIDNGIRHTDSGSVGVDVAVEGKKLKLSVSDTGSGIAEEHISRIFERFYVADRSRSRKAGGTGLGLSIAKHIVLQHHGEIDVKSTPGQGTTFEIYIPLKQPAYHRN